MKHIKLFEAFIGEAVEPKIENNTLSTSLQEIVKKLIQNDKDSILFEDKEKNLIAGFQTYQGWNDDGLASDDDMPGWVWVKITPDKKATIIDKYEIADMLEDGQANLSSEAYEGEFLKSQHITDDDESSYLDVYNWNAGSGDEIKGDLQKAGVNISELPKHNTSDDGDFYGLDGSTYTRDEMENWGREVFPNQFEDEDEDEDED